MYTLYREDPRPAPLGLTPNQIDPRCEFFKKETLKFEKWFAEMWVHCYPHYHLHTQVRLCDETSHKADFMHWPTKTIIEIDGGTYSGRNFGGGHGAGKNYKKDGIAAYLGFAVFRITTTTVRENYKKQQFEFLEIIAATIRRRYERF